TKQSADVTTNSKRLRRSWKRAEMFVLTIMLISCFNSPRQKEWLKWKNY
ncbi:MAG: hypothetical protein ACI9HK_005599, partial [Pirellulaceae bacterium]